MQNKWFLSLVLGVILSGLAMYLAFRNVPFAELAAYIRTIHYAWLVPTSLLVLLTFILRTFRWQLILKGYQRIDFREAFHPLMIGFMMNCILPGRVGEIARPTLLRQQRGIPITTGLATVATERICDIFILILLFGLVFGNIARHPDLEIAFGAYRLNSQTLQTIAWTMIRLAGIMLLGLCVVVIPWTRQRLKGFIIFSAGLIGRLSPGTKKTIDRVMDFIIKIIDNVAAGLDLVKYPRRLTACGVLTISIWGVTLLSYHVFTLGCPGITLDIAQLTTLMVVICFFIALPSVPGFWGLWEAGGVFALSLFDIPARDAAGFTLVNHAIQIIPVIVVGWISALITGSNIMQLIGKQRSESAAASGPVES
jgi:uncharacterized protein (TIRG00374 family)